MGRTRPTKRTGLSVRDYAAHRKSAGLIGGNKSAVQKALKAGRIHYVDGDPTKGIDPERADAEWAAATDPARVHPQAHEAARATLPDRPTNGHPIGDGAVPDYQVSRARKEHFEAELRRLDLRERLRAIVPTEVVVQQVQAMTSNVRQRLLRLPAKLGPTLAAAALETAEDPDRVPRALETILEAEVRRILRTLEEDPTGAKAAQEAEDRRKAEEGVA